MNIYLEINIIFILKVFVYIIYVCSGVVVPGEVGILLIYAPDFFIYFFNGPAKACT